MLFFAKPVFLWLLLLVPLIPLVYGFVRRSRRSRLRRFGEEDQVRALMPSWSSAKGWVRIVLFALAFGFFAIGLARPQMGAKLSERETKGAEIIICLDVSNSMLARDYSPDRLERAKLAISRIVDKLEGDRIGLIVFAGTSFVQLPITTDYVSAKMFLNSIGTDSVPVQGTAIGDAIHTAVRSFSAQSEKSRAIIVITDGENHEDDPVEAAREAAEAGIKVYTIGVGSLRGQPIPKDGDLLKDSSGEIVVSRLDEQTLQQIASEGGGAYVHAGNDEFGLNPIVDDIRKLEDEIYNSVVFEEYDELYMYFFAAALALFVAEPLIGSRRHRRKLFLLLFLLSTFSASAQTDRREVRSGNRKFRSEQVREAEIDYRKALLKDSLSFAGNYNLASTLYREGDYEAAAQSLSKAEQSALSSPRASDCFFNAGDAALQKKDYASAVQEFRKSLLLNPGDLAAKENYIYAKKMLENQQNGGGGQDNQDQNQDNQDQNQNQDQDQNQDNRNNQDNQNQQDNQENQDQQRQQQKISPQQAQQMLNAIQAQEKKTQDKVNKEKAALLQSRQKEKNW